MYAAARQVIAAAGGVPWEQGVRTRIVTPRHMDRTPAAARRLGA